MVTDTNADGPCVALLVHYLQENDVTALLISFQGINGVPRANQKVSTRQNFKPMVQRL
jgi:hypothetical protein